MATEPTASEINELKKKLDADPDSMVFAALADAYRKQGNLKDALAICKKGLEKHPSFSSGIVVLGRTYQSQGKVQEASAEFKKVLELDPENLMAHSLLGSIYMEQGDYQAAIEEYQKVLTLNPDDDETQTSLKLAIEKAAGDSKGPKEAKKETPPAEKKPAGKESTATLTMAELYLKQGHPEKAIEVYQELLGSDPQNLMLRQKLSEVVEKQKKDSDPKSAAAPAPKGDSSDASKGKKEDDSKFTSEDILQVMRKGGKDDGFVEEKKPAGKKPEPAEPVKTPAVSAPAAAESAEKTTTSNRLSEEQLQGLKGLLAELGAVEGVLRCFLIGNDGNTVVSVGETSNNADLGNQALAIFQSTQRSIAQLSRGKLQQVAVTAENGHIILLYFTSLVLVVLANQKVNMGLLRLSLESALKKSVKFF